MQGEHHEIEVEFPEFRQRIEDLSTADPGFAESHEQAAKRAITQTYDIRGLEQALRKGADTSVKIETLETELRRRFNQILRSEGLKHALAWREARLDRNE